MGCCELKDESFSSSELLLNVSSKDSFKDLSIFSNKCEIKISQQKTKEMQITREHSYSNSSKQNLEAAFIIVSPKRLQEKHQKNYSNLTPENTDETNLTEYQNETLSRV